MEIKVLLVATSIDEIGGQSIQAKRLLDAFAENETIEIGFVPNNPRLSKSFRWLQNIKFTRTIFTSLKFWWLLLKTIRKYEVVQVFSSAMTGYVIATLPPLFISKLYGKKVVLNYHSGELEVHIKRWKRLALPTMKMFDAIVVPSEFLVDIFRKFGLNAKAIYNFVDTNNFKFRERKNLRPKLLSNRNFEAHYDVSCIIRAFNELQKAFLEAELTIAGYGSEEAQLKQLVKELGLKNVKFVGKVSNDEMPKFYDAADIYLNSSIVDNMPLSIIEAFSAGIPVVSTNAGGIPYIVANEKTGLLVEINDYEALASEAIRLLEDTDLAKNLIAQAHSECDKYAWKNVKNEWLKFYDNVFADK